MSFVIKNEIEQSATYNEVNHVFDILPYNYTFNNSTAFIDSKFAQDDPKQLDHVLKQVQTHKGDKYLQQLNFIRVHELNKS